MPPPRFFLWLALLSPVLVVGLTAACVAWLADRVAAWCQKVWTEAYHGK